MTFDALFALQPDGQDRWIGPPAPRTSEKRLFGGVLIGQAIVAASAQTKRCHALHAFFIGAGALGQPFGISAERIRDGASFATRRIEIRQGERPLLICHTSHHDGDDGPDGQMSMPDVPPPETWEDQRGMRIDHTASAGKPARVYLSEEMLEERAEPFVTSANGRAVWFRPRVPIEGGRALHQAVIGFASDSGLVRTGVFTHGLGEMLQSASLDHSIWFHRDASANDWMLHVQSAPSMAHGRGLSRATVFTRDGVLVASVTQEILARRKRNDGEEGAGNGH